MDIDNIIRQALGMLQQGGQGGVLPGMGGMGGGLAGMGGQGDLPPWIGKLLDLLREKGAIGGAGVGGSAGPLSGAGPSAGGAPTTGEPRGPTLGGPVRTAVPGRDWWWPDQQGRIFLPPNYVDPDPRFWVHLPGDYNPDPGFYRYI